ncbi:olfactory receptor class A-like protein 1 [Protopterus annectens]|uniref:olfactory receptor class A-like protein 1 n=1 Tax=Protopterus annectens TaxID=7888 RepID=UPI001CF9427C|nr:olfactory receptor class A-like protein 1 [Protopterus annectens]
MDIESIIIGFIFCLTTSIGIVGNVIVLAVLVWSAYQDKLLSSEVILSNLALSNLIFLLSGGIPTALFKFRIKYLNTDADCKADIYMIRIFRTMIINLTCLLSCFQYAVITSPSSRMFCLKAKMQKYFVLIMIFLYIISISSSVYGALYPVANANTSTLMYAFDLGYCFVIYPNGFIFQMTGFMNFAQDLIFLTLMVVTSICILVILYRHGKQMKSIRHSKENQETSAEHRASKATVTLVLLYEILYGIECAVWFYQLSASTNHLILNDVRHFLSLAFPSFFPEIILFFNQKLRKRLHC